MTELSQSTKNLIKRYQEWHQSLQPVEGKTTIHVDEIASKVASFYEKMRGVVEWREEHLLRKTAIERILKRRLLLKKDTDLIAEPLIKELIRGGHFPNDTILEEKISQVQKLIDKYIFIIENSPAPAQEKMRLQLYDWLLGIAACEVEDTMSPYLRENSLIEFMLELMRERIQLQSRTLISQKMSEEERIVQIYIAIQKALFKLDLSLISYNLLKKWFTDWKNLPPEKIKEVTENIYLIWEKLKNSLKHPLAEKFFQICERYDTAYLILGDIISKNPQEIEQTLTDANSLEKEIRASYNLRLKKVKSRMRRAAFYSTISIFLTKILVAFLLEVPFDKYITNQFNYLTLGLSIAIPPLLMFFLVLSIRQPSKQNAELTIMEVIKITYQRERKETYEIRSDLKRGFVLNSVITIFYSLSFLISFGLIIWGLTKIHFSFFSILIFLIFISLISFTGIKIRQRAKELIVEKEKDTFLHTLFDLFSLPLLRVGKWLSGQWLKYNIVMVLLNSLIDMPFQVFVEFLEKWRAFLKEKREEIH